MGLRWGRKRMFDEHLSHCGLWSSVLDYTYFRDWETRNGKAEVTSSSSSLDNPITLAENDKILVSVPPGSYASPAFGTKVSMWARTTFVLLRSERWDYFRQLTKAFYSVAFILCVFFLSWGRISKSPIMHWGPNTESLLYICTFRAQSDPMVTLFTYICTSQARAKFFYVSWSQLLSHRFSLPFLYPPIPFIFQDERVYILTYDGLLRYIWQRC